MAKGNGTTRNSTPVSPKGLAGNAIQSGSESQQIANAQILENASSQIGSYTFTNEISGTYEVTRKDLRNLIHKIGQDKDLAEIKTEVANNIRSIVETGEYVGWSAPDDGKHPEVAYFAYYSKELSKKVYLGMRFMKSEKTFKPYAIYSEDGFKERVNKIEKGKPTI